MSSTILTDLEMRKSNGAGYETAMLFALRGGEGKGDHDLMWSLMIDETREREFALLVSSGDDGIDYTVSVRMARRRRAQLWG